MRWNEARPPGEAQEESWERRHELGARPPCAPPSPKRPRATLGKASPETSRRPLLVRRSPGHHR